MQRGSAKGCSANFALGGFYELRAEGVLEVSTWSAPRPPGRLTSTRVPSPGAESTEQVPPSDDAVRTSIVEQWIGIYEITSAFGDGDDPPGGSDGTDGSRG
jgi:hypothetical protein